LAFISGGLPLVLFPFNPHDGDTSPADVVKVRSKLGFSYVTMKFKREWKIVEDFPLYSFNGNLK